jgi:hypothetical protein
MGVQGPILRQDESTWATTLKSKPQYFLSSCVVLPAPLLAADSNRTLTKCVRDFTHKASGVSHMHKGMEGVSECIRCDWAFVSGNHGIGIHHFEIPITLIGTM